MFLHGSRATAGMVFSFHESKTNNLVGSGYTRETFRVRLRPENISQVGDKAYIENLGKEILHRLQLGDSWGFRSELLCPLGAKMNALFSTRPPQQRHFAIARGVIRPPLLGELLPRIPHAWPLRII